MPEILDWLIPAFERLAWEALLSMKVQTPDTSRSAPASRPLLEAPLEAVAVAADTNRLFPSIGSGQISERLVRLAAGQFSINTTYKLYNQG